MPPLGLLEYFDQTDRRDVAQKQARSLEASVFADAHGCSRVLIAEHHGRLSPSASPVQLASVVACHTTNVRIGTAISLLRIRNTYLTAVEFSTLVSLAGDRVDVGLGRGDFGGPGARHVAAERKSDAVLHDAFSRLREFLLEGTESLPPAATPPEFWIHGTSVGSAALAAELGMNFCFGLFLKDDLDAAIAALHHFARHSSRTTALAVSAVGNRCPTNAAADAAGVRDVAVNFVGDLEDLGYAMRRLVGLSGAEELLLAELSSDTSDHLAAIEHVTKAVA